MSYLQAEEETDHFGYARDAELDAQLGGLAGKVKWSGGKAGKFDAMGRGYGSDEDSPENKAIVAAYNARQVAAAAGFESIEEYNAAMARSAALAVPGAASPAVATPPAGAAAAALPAGAAYPEYILPAAAPVVAAPPAGAEYPDPYIDTPTAEATIMGVPSTTFLGAAAVVVLGLGYFLTKKK